MLRCSQRGSTSWSGTCWPRKARYLSTPWTCPPSPPPQEARAPSWSTCTQASAPAGCPPRSRSA
eukprot:scaffold3884_cov392-Prasinococcus_capsulatus_cf.AAC.19